MFTVSLSGLTAPVGRNGLVGGPFGLTRSTDEGPFGMEEAALTHAVDVSAFIARKREAVRCHASQVTDTSFFLQMPTELFTLVLGTEWFIDRGVPADLRDGWLLD